MLSKNNMKHLWSGDSVSTNQKQRIKAYVNRLQLLNDIIIATFSYNVALAMFLFLIRTHHLRISLLSLLEEYMHIHFLL